MKYCVPVNAANEVELLASAGAGELYCGFQDPWWIEHYGDHDSATRRQGSANLFSFDELRRTAEVARSFNLPLYLALNSRYTEPQLDHLVGLCDAFSEVGGTGVIASDLGLLWRLRDNRNLSRTLSLLAVAQNVPTLKAYESLGISRVVLPRFIEPYEAEQLLAEVPGMQAEVMAFFDKCPLVDGYCRHRHAVSYADREQGGDDEPPLYTYDTTYRTHACLGTSCTYLEPYPCAACFLRQFENAGVEYAKLGGRGRPLDERLRALRFLVRAETLSSDASRQEFYRATFGQECACYYGSSTQGRSAIEPVFVSEEPGRSYVGSQTSVARFTDAVGKLLHGEGEALGEAFTLMVPPLSERELAWFVSLLPQIASTHQSAMHVCVNDLGTLIEVTRENRELGLGLTITLGTLLARLDDPVEVARSLDPKSNPPRPVWGPYGDPRMLTYYEPPQDLQRHWVTPSACEPSAQEALCALTGESGFAYEFDSR